MSFRNLVVIAVAAVISVACWSINAKSRYANLFAEALTKIDRYALADVEDRTLFENAMRGMLRGLDKHSDFLTGDRYEQFEEKMKGEFGGVGMFVGVDPRNDDLTITAVLPGTPAFQAGLRAGDVIRSIDARTTQGMSRSEAIQLMRGLVGETVHLQIGRDAETLQVELSRSVIPIRTVLGDHFTAEGQWDYLLAEDSRIGYVNITDFSEHTAQELEAVLQKLASCQALIMDLRSDAGGLLPQAVEVCDLFFDKRLKIVEIRGRGGRLVEPPYMSTERCLFDPRKPMVILIDRNSASASEIVAACMQDHGRATIMGEPSYGKGTVQNVYPLERHRSSIKLTTATYWSPNGRNIDQSAAISQSQGAFGVHPDRGYDFKFSESELFRIDLLRNQRQYKALEIFAVEPPANPAAADPAKSPAAAEGTEATSELTEDPVLQQAREFLQKTLDRQGTT